MKIDYDIFDDINPGLAKVTGDFFLTGFKDLSRLMNIAAGAEIFSCKSEKEFDHVMDMVFLYAYLFLLNAERKDILEMTGSLPSRADIYEDYAIDSVRQYFACNFIEIIPLLAEFDVTVPAVGDYDGIGYMHIQPGDNPQFIIQ